jgi:hypothetical protein
MQHLWVIGHFRPYHCVSCPMPPILPLVQWKRVAAAHECYAAAVETSAATSVTAAVVDGALVLIHEDCIVPSLLSSLCCQHQFPTQYLSTGRR